MFKPSLEVLEDRTMPSFSWLPPEINSARIFAGAGSGPLLSAAASWNGLAAELSAAASAYETAFAMTVPPPSIAANRVTLSTLVATNFLGQNTPAIMATEAQYTEMWAQDATAMANYTGTPLPSPNAGVASASADEVSAALAALFGAHAQMYQALSSQTRIECGKIRP